MKQDVSRLEHVDTCILDVKIVYSSFPFLSNQAMRENILIDKMRRVSNKIFHA